MCDEELFHGRPRRAPFYSVEDHGELTVLRFGLRLSEYAVDLDETRRLWKFLTDGHNGPKRVLLITSEPGTLSPARIDEFWDRIHDGQAKADLPSAEALSHLDIAREENTFRHFVEIIRRIDSFVITVLHGECDFCFLGAALACEYRIAAKDTMFVNRLFYSEATAGVLPWFLSRFLGHAEAADILLEGRSLTASEAYEIKLLNKLAFSGDLEQISLDTARRFAAIPAPALRALKRSLVASVEGLGIYLDQIGAGFQHVKGPPAAGPW